MRLTNTTALVTGATSGIGQAITRTFSDQGARLLLTGRRADPPKLPRHATYVAGDVNDETFVARLADQAARDVGSINAVVINHGLQHSGPLATTSHADAVEVLHTNLLSAFLVMKHFAPLMPADGGTIVCIGSRLGMVGQPGEVLYSAAKGGLIMLARGAAIEWAPRNIRVNVVAPGLTATSSIESFIGSKPDPDGYRRQRESSIPMRRLATPAEVADAVWFLSSSQSSYITGAVLPVDGGYTAA